MSEKPYKLRSIPDKENYATYLALPFLELSKYSFGEDNFMNSYVTVNANIGVLVRNIDAIPWNFWEHIHYRTDMPLYDGELILFKCPKNFEQDMLYLLDSKFSKLSCAAVETYKDYSGMAVDFRNKDGELVSHRLILAMRGDTDVRTQLGEHLGCEIPASMELEPSLRDQDILYDVDTDINFIYAEYSKKQ